MKTINKILIPVIALGLSACKTIEEGVSYKTKKEDIGKLDYSRKIPTKWPESKRTFIVTDSLSFAVRGEPEIKPGTWCYFTQDKIRNISGHTHNVKYFTWPGNKKEKKFRVYGRGRCR